MSKVFKAVYEGNLSKLKKAMLSSPKLCEIRRLPYDTMEEESLLYAALTTRNMKVIDFLIANNCTIIDSNEKEIKEMIECMKDSVAMTRLLIDIHKRILNKEDNELYIFLCMMNGANSTMIKYIKRRFDLTLYALNNFGNAIVEKAAFKGYYDVINAMIIAGIDVDLDILYSYDSVL